MAISDVEQKAWDATWAGLMALADALPGSGETFEALSIAGDLFQVAYAVHEGDCSPDERRRLMDLVARVRTVVRGRSSDDRSVELAAAIDLANAIDCTAHTDGRMGDILLEDFRGKWPRYGAALDPAKFWDAVRAWQDVDAGKRKDRWPPVTEAIESAGLGKRDPASFARQFRGGDAPQPTDPGF